MLAELTRMIHSTWKVVSNLNLANFIKFVACQFIVNFNVLQLIFQASKFLQNY